MSGDVQPRRRKDKKKKRAEEGLSSGEETSTPIATEPQWTGASGGEWMHAQSDHGTGGHWCAKIVFFLLLAVLITLISLIILENRGLQDLEERDVAESRYAAVFDGWLEDEPHDDHHDPHTLELTHPEEEEDDHNEHESDIEDEIEEIEKESDFAEKGDDDHDGSEEDEDHDDDEEGDTDHDGDYDENDDDDDSGEDNTNGEDGEENGIDDDNNYDDQSDDDDEENVFNDNNSHEDDDEGESDQEQDNDDDDDLNNSEEDANDDYLRAERKTTVDHVQFDRPLEEVDDDDVEEVIDNHAAEEEHLARVAAEQDDELETSNMGLKFGVGVALVVVAHWVLVRKWRNDRNNETTDNNGTSYRRLTLVEDGEEPDNSKAKEVTRPVTTGVSFAQNIAIYEEEGEEDYSEEQSDDEIVTKKNVTNTFTTAECKPEVQSPPWNSENEQETELTDDEEAEIVDNVDAKDAVIPEKELVSEDEDEDVEDVQETDDADDYEHIDEEEENLEEEQVNEEDEISDVDDVELMKKLEQKYGKLPSEKNEPNNDSIDRTHSSEQAW